MKFTIPLAMALPLFVVASGAAQVDAESTGQDAAPATDSLPDIPPPPQSDGDAAQVDSAVHGRQGDDGEARETRQSIESGESQPGEISGTTHTNDRDADSDANFGVRLEANTDGRLVVQSVTEGSLVADAGIGPGDEIVSVDGKPFATASALRAYLRDHSAERMQVTVLRNGVEQTVVLNGTAESPHRSSARPALGVRFFRGPTLHVVDVVEGSPADRAGVFAGDVIISMNGNRFSSTDAFIAAVAEADVNQDVELVLDRRGTIVVATVPFASWETVYDTPSTTVTALRPDLDADGRIDVITARHVGVHPAAYGYYGYPYYWTHHHHSYYWHYHWPAYVGPYFYAPYPGPVYYGPAFAYWPANVSWRYPVYSAYVW